MEQGISFGLAALGKGGTFVVEVLSRRDGGWSLFIESQSWCFGFELAGSGAVSELAVFLRTYIGQTEFAELVVGSFGGMAVRVVKDNEFRDRFFIRASGDGSVVEFTLVGEATQEFAAAVAEAAAEIDV